MHARIREMETEVKNVCEESRRTKQILEENVGKALEKQYAAQEETMRAKDKTIALLENQVKKLEEEKRLIQDQLSDQEKDMRNAAHLTEQPAAVSGKEDLQDALPEHILRQNFWKKWKGLTQKKISSESKNFIEHYIKDENYTEEQKNFFLDCMEEGMSAEEIAGLASHNLSVDVMKRLKKIEEQRRTRDRKKKKGEKDYGTV